jgi:hypothetical protein
MTVKEATNFLSATQYHVTQLEHSQENRMLTQSVCKVVTFSFVCEIIWNYTCVCNEGP